MGEGALAHTPINYSTLLRVAKNLPPRTPLHNTHLSAASCSELLKPSQKGAEVGDVMVSNLRSQLH